MFKPIVRIRNWNSWDELAGRKLKDGERLKLKFPDGSVKTTKIRVREWEQVIPDHGMPGSYRQSESYLMLKVRGLPVEIPLAGVLAERARKSGVK